MRKIAILAEKPDQARKLASPFPHKKEKNFIAIDKCDSFPSGAVIVWAIGHLIQLAEPKVYHPDWEKWDLQHLPMIPEQFKYQVIKSKSGHFKEVKKHLINADEIIIATDPAREGELIARLIIQMAGASKKPIKRLWTSSLTESAIQNAFKNLHPGESTISFYHEALARSWSDWLVGINSSRVYTLLLQRKGIRGVFSIGRVQTPLLTLIRHREEEIEQFKSEPFWELVGTFKTSTGQQYRGKHSKKFKDQKEVQALLETINNHSGIIAKIETKKKATKPPKLHSLSTLQTKMNKRFKYSPSRVLEIVQALYEKGYVSYPRTDSQYVTPAEATTFPGILEKLCAYFPVPDQLKEIKNNMRYVDPAKVSDHYAIIPTDQVPDPEQLGRDEKIIYDEIARSLIAAHCADYEYNETNILTEVNGIPFETKGKQPLKSGWKKVFQEEENQESKEESVLLPDVSEAESVQANIRIHEDMTKPPKPYTEGQLIQLMKTAGKHIEDEELQEEMKGIGLGTEATRAGIIQTLKDREYITVEKNVVRVTEKGKLLVKAVEGTSLAKPDLTAQWEKYLYQIGKGEKSHIPFVKRSKELASKLVEDAKQHAKTWNIDGLATTTPSNSGFGPCPRCGKQVIDKKKFYGCSGYQEGCKFTLPKEFCGKKLTETNVKKLLEKGKSNLVKGFTSKKGNNFDAYLVLDEKQKLSFQFKS
ncbi:DNA topoisomerase 3 [Thermoactinomyces sp. FSL K6-2592]|jgi:DNA topoisomerase III|uniref:type IA DNA topoisomerase n=1 Tax=Thermoactinomyces sp. FSL K6-2592 TaxID=2975347 RepID=UPI0030F67DAB